MKLHFRSGVIVAATIILMGSLTRVHSQEASVARSNLSQIAEAKRVQTVMTLLKQRAKLIEGDPQQLKACDDEIKLHPAPAENNAATLKKCLVGKWHSPRHDYLFRADGSWTMLPAEKGTVHGQWRIEGNQLEQTSGYTAAESTARYTLILLTNKDYISTDGESVFCETRLAR